MKTIGIIGAMDEEIELIKSKIKNISEKTIKNIKFFTGNIENKKIILVQSWIWKVNASIATTFLINRFEPELIINTWSAGWIDKNLKIWDVVIGTKIIHHDVDVTEFGYKLWQIPKMPEFFESDKTLVEIIKNSPINKELNIIYWLIASWDQFISNNNQKNILIKNFFDLKAIEMESAAIAQTSKILDTPFIIVRSISDNADGSAWMNFNDFLPIASQNSAKIILSILKEI